MFTLDSFQLSDMTLCGTRLREMGEGADSFEEVASRTVRYLYDNFGQKSGERAFSLVRLFMTHPLEELEEPLKKAALSMVADADARRSKSVKCLALMATAGDLPEWNDRHQSRDHRVFPLQGEEFVQKFPMIAQLLQQFGVTFNPFIASTDELVLDKDQTSFNVFHVPEASKCPYIGAQEQFIQRHGIRSVLGFGGLLSRGSLFAVILFSKVPVSKETALMFKPLALSSKNALMQTANRKIFTPRESNHLHT